jgi:hypothetical protein
MTIPNPVLDAKQAADRVIAIEKVINAEYKRNKRITNAIALDTAMLQFRQQFQKVMQLYPEWSHLIPNVSKPIHMR